jgi:glycerophosphoryl diester phosphodiesterase
VFDDHVLGIMFKTCLGAAAFGAVASWAYLRHVMLPAGPDRREWAEQVYAHRGCRFIPGIPENTVPAFQYAALNCAAGVECDIRMCKSGDLVVFHDAVLGQHVTNRSPELSEKIHELTLNELQSLDLTEDVDKRGVRLCTLEDVIAVCREHDLRVLIELKPTPGANKKQRELYVRKILDTFERHDDFLYDRAMVISFSPFLLYQLRCANPKIAVIQLSRPDLISLVVTTHGESKSAPFWLKLLPLPVADRLTHFVLYSVAPWVIGASAVGVPYTSYSDVEVHRWTHRKMFLYLWGFSAPETCTASMRSPGVAVAVDGEFGQYYLRPRYPFRAATDY